MRWSLALGLLLSGCASGGHEILEGTPVRPVAASRVVLHGVEGAGPAPTGCQVLGRVRAWSRGEKTYPYHALRVAAARLGGDAVIDLRPDPAARDRHRPTHLGTVVRCR